MMTKNHKYNDDQFYLKIKSFVFQGFSLLKEDLDKVYDIRDDILRNNNPFYMTMLSKSKPNFSYLINSYKQQLENLPEFCRCDEYMKQHHLLSKFIFISGEVGTKCDLRTRWSSHYLLSLLEKIAEVYFIQNITKKSKMLQNELDDIFDELYSDYDFSFFNKNIPFRNIIPLHNFQLNDED